MDTRNEPPQLYRVVWPVLDTEEATVAELKLEASRDLAKMLREEGLTPVARPVFRFSPDRTQLVAALHVRETVRFLSA